MTVQEKTLVPGLAGIPAAESAISFIDGQAGILEYRGHRIELLAEKSNFEEVAWLLREGTLPTQSQLDAFSANLRAIRAEVPSSLVTAIQSMPRDGHPMDALQASMAMLGMAMGHPDLTDEDSRVLAADRIIALTPVLVAAFERHRQGKEFVAPDPDLDTAANFLWMLNGEKPDELATGIFDVALILHAEHTMNASTFACRVVASTESSPYSACSGAIGTLSGPLHGGANERVLNQLRTIDGPDNVRAWVDERLASKKKIMGFGHRVYKVKDPRAHNIQALMGDLFEKLGRTPIYDIALELEKVIAEKLGDKGIAPNVDYFSGIVYEKLGIPTDVFTPVFALARVTGYTAHWLEQMRDNKLFRPGQIYVGVRDSKWVDIADRG